jgi:hypothetical protein
VVTRAPYRALSGNRGLISPHPLTTSGQLPSDLRCFLSFRRMSVFLVRQGGFVPARAFVVSRVSLLCVREVLGLVFLLLVAVSVLVVPCLASSCCGAP